MKWQIRVHCKNKAWQYPTYLLKEIRVFLYRRGYTFIDNCFIDPWNNTVSIDISNAQEIIEVNLTAKEVVKQPRLVGFPLLRPQGVMLVEDYFRTRTDTWYYLETLTATELEAIEHYGRALEPIHIKRALEQPYITASLSPRHCYSFNSASGYTSDFYVGTQCIYKNIVNFWIAYLSWYDRGMLEENELGFLIHQGWFEALYGSCIPQEGAPFTIDVSTISKGLIGKELKGCYLMRKDGDDQITLFDYQDIYIIQQHWTGE